MFGTRFEWLQELVWVTHSARRLTWAAPHLTYPRTVPTHHADPPRTAAAGTFQTPGVVSNGRTTRITFPTDRQSATAALCPTFPTRPSYLHHHHRRRRRRRSCCHSPPSLPPLAPLLSLPQSLCRP
ncbi:hypothetical protein O3P69_007628 [Scylla paramamosain]|uniref:Uncharacterized protein n=1 Tax=Scylla paramamosain TaxID=85552 RepID=A0AAW0UZQ7_SCYPA